ncbi:RNA polymerase factor sigma-54 [Vibrio cincinnatiensis]|jgi:RNA polymerase sigma-54 factor|uniref:RNA polymerase sigma-54 factor n=1 Tax=Vibrio cincinnatiensis DSM 19608 TaxID=1123491 RepID=A0A1T4QUX6_VIBCI|nr:RNA polymerase factor sigma-54 [Vibrio cincinnatiensis]MCG3735835.1 RNA polymerase factor sigma-54 [Vibrio cincinnatiensis]MCG3746756.1 RNA polymerase factor sigma-54 [Vibrio cincinnatiensis]MCG3758031.1 RNA polymerase factor sigma-54 [Vibrio cincinnatiensis]MCG3761327.1 RNA polymerase factor sigma-54 [Vibrio cincinnatiensis]MCG3766613.1 RNA polymerase factor sigma-54 [Vibrio cincinnatiensis]
MKPSLQLKLGQQLAMTPQLQQAIRLLQLSTLDLQQEIQEALESNPLLDVEESTDELPTLDNASSRNEDSEVSADISEPEPQDSSSLIEKSEISAELEIDTTWEDIYSANTGSTGIALDEDMPVYQGETTQTLQDYLLWQLDLTPFSDTDRSIAYAIIDAIDDYGYLTTTLEDLLDNFNREEVELDEVEAVRKRIQQFDPLGVASLNLQDCLLLQLATYPENTPWLNEAKMLLRDYIDLLGNRDFKQIVKESKLKEEDLREILQLIQELDPRPGSRISQEHAEYVVPDVSVYKERGKWQVSINPDSVPRLKINQQYASLARGNNADSNYIRSNLQEAKWLIKSLESRNETLLKVAKCIVEHQHDFFEYGEEAMKPMVLNDVAQAVEMHESTISRVTTQKYMHTPRGIFELKYFFSSHVSTDNGGECSSTAIRALIKKLVAAENPAKPLSDSKIAALLADQGIQVARRTIAKYRESLAIAPSSQRKRLL